MCTIPIFNLAEFRTKSQNRFCTDITYCKGIREIMLLSRNALNALISHQKVVDNSVPNNSSEKNYLHKFAIMRVTCAADTLFVTFSQQLLQSTSNVDNSKK